jgi:AraC family transcriptional activator of mtrCDE
MDASNLDRLLAAMDVAVDAFAVCEISHGRRLTANAPAIEVHYVVAGELYLSVDDAPPIRCGTGSIVIVPPGRPQAMAADDNSATDVAARDVCSARPDGLLLFDAANGQAGDLRLICGEIRADLGNSFGLLDGMAGPIVEDMRDTGFIAAALAAMLEELAQPRPGSRALTGALMKACLIALLRRHLERPAQDNALLGALHDARLGKAIGAVLAAPGAAHSVTSLACLSGMSRSAFAKAFTGAFDATPMEFVARTRLHQARGLLRSTRAPVKAIASSVGIASRSHFSRAFRRAYGMDPSDFRRTEQEA